MPDERSVEEQILEAQERRTAGEVVPIEHAGADLSGFQLPGADLTGANFEGADLTGAILAGAHLSRANFKGAILIGATLDGADLSDADLRGADLAGARIDDVILAGARLEGACLQAVAGDPLSMAGARMDKETIEISDFTMRDIAQMVVRGVDVRENEATPLSEKATDRASTSEQPVSVNLTAGALSLMVGPTGAPSILPLVMRGAMPDSGARGTPSEAAPEPSSKDPVSSKKVFDPDSPSSSKRLVETFDFDQPVSGMPGLGHLLSSLPPVGAVQALDLEEMEGSRVPSIVPLARVEELEARQQMSEVADEVPISQRMFQQLNALINDARLEAGPADSIRPQRMSVKQLAQSGFRFPQVGEQFLGVTIKQELPSGSTSRCFRGAGTEGESLVVRIFDPECQGAALQLPAFQRGLRALNRLQGLEDEKLLVSELYAVAADLTAYVVRAGEGGSLLELLKVSLSFDQGLEAIASLARSVARLHAHGIMVRAWKPSNVLVDGFQLVISEPDMVHLPTLTQSRGDAAGYEAYAAPEELVGRGTRSPTADIYSLGKMLEFLLTGEEPLVPLGSPPLIAQRDNIPETLVEIVKRATHQHPTQRYARVEDLLTDLENFREHGDRAVLVASIRPDGDGRLQVPLLTSNKNGDAQQAISERLRVHDNDEEDEVSEDSDDVDWPRQVEVGIAMLAGVGGLVMLAPLVLAPRSVEQMDGLSLYMAMALGTFVLAAPRPPARRFFFRLSTWALTAALIWLLDPLALTHLTWRSRLRSGATFQKEEAARVLARLGARDMSGVFLDRGQFQDAQFGNVDFSGSSLKSVNFRGALLVETKFQGADLNHADLRGANLHGADLSSALGLSAARCNRHTMLPEPWTCSDGLVSAGESPKPPKPSDKKPSGSAPTEEETDEAESDSPEGEVKATE